MIEFIVGEPENPSRRPHQEVEEAKGSQSTGHSRERPDAIAWAAQPGPQSDLCSCPYTEIFFGGARGGGKTDGVLGKWALKERRYGQHFNAIMFRRTSVSAEDAIERSREIYAPLGGRFNETKLRWRMPNGGRVAFAYLENTADANEYQGRNVTDAWVEEAGQYPTASPIDRLFGVLRSSHGVPIQLILTANPGGPGQHWIRQRYQIHPFPKRPIILTRTLANGNPHRVAVIPSRITDNKILMQMDPGYIDRLHMVGSPQLVRAWLEGDWSAIEGAFFTEWDEGKHVIPAFAIPESWLRFRSADWGSFSPFSIGWWAVAGDDYALEGALSGESRNEPALHRSGTVPRAREDLLGSKLLRPDDHSMDPAGSEKVHIIPRGALIRYREWYGAVGGKLTAEQVAEGIAVREKADRQRLTYGVLDPSAFIESGGPSIAENMNRILTMERPSLASFRKADNKRVARNIGDPAKSGPMGGWDQLRQRLKGRKGVPMIYCFPNCADSIRTIPVLQHDETKLEDLDTEAEDHCADDWRYACMSRPWIKAMPLPERPKDSYRPAQEERNDLDSALLL